MGSTRRATALLLVALAGCCSSDPADLQADDADDRREALACLAEDAQEDPSLRPAVVQGARRLAAPDEPSAAVRATAIRALAYLQHGESGELIAERLAGAERDGHPRVRREAIGALGSLRGYSAEDPLVYALVHDEDADVRGDAARELGGLSGASGAASARLAEALGDPVVGVRLSARRALRELHGVDLGESRDAWEEWLDEQIPAVEPEPEPIPAAPFPAEPLPGEPGSPEPDDGLPSVEPSNDLDAFPDEEPQ